MRVIRGREAGKATDRGGPDRFTGTVWLDPVLSNADIRCNYVSFEPGSRTHWHTHTGGQILFVLGGEGRVCQEGGQVSTIRAGDVVHIQAGEKHWHGAGPTSVLAHMAVTVGETDWLNPVTDTDYGAEPAG